MGYELKVTTGDVHAKAARQIQSQLEQIGRSLNLVGSNYDTVEAQNVSSLR